MVKAMQDPGAGVKLVEFGPKRGKAATKYFTGKDAIEWLISWSFANDRTSGATLATEMLRNGFFHTVNLDPITNSLALSKDGILSRDVMDSEEAKYVFVSMTSTNPNAVFQSDDDSSSDSEDDILATSSRPESLAAETGFDSDGKVLKQGFLLKKGKVLKEWKPRRFVLREKSPYLYFYRGSKVCHLIFPRHIAISCLPRPCLSGYVDSRLAHRPPLRSAYVWMCVCGRATQPHLARSHMRGPGELSLALCKLVILMIWFNRARSIVGQFHCVV
jgi:hypothetical protein